MDRTGKFKSYPAYKDSGVEWLGEIPAHWLSISIKNLDPYNAELAQTGPFGAQLHAEDYIDDGVPLTLIRNVNNLRIDDTNIPRISKEDADRLCQYKLKEGDIVFSRVGSIGRIAPITKREEGWLISGQMLRLRIRNKDLNNKFFLYALSSRLITDAISYYSVGSTRESINTDILKNLFLSVPPLTEQQAIAAFLDRETTKIDDLIAKQERLIELLQEKRTALISHAGTKGLDPSVPMKDSGVEWLGKVPAQWKTGHLRWFSKRFSGGTPDKSVLEYWTDGTIPWLGSGEVNQKLITTPTTYITVEAFNNSSAKWIPKGALVMALAGQGKTKGMVAQLAIDTTCNQSLAAIIPIAIKVRFLYYWLETNYRNIRGMASDDLRDGLNLDLIANIDCPIPPDEEQQAIADFLDRETAKIDNLIAKARDAITLLKEHRTALISAAVTGKIDARNEHLSNQPYAG